MSRKTLVWRHIIFIGLFVNLSCIVAACQAVENDQYVGQEDNETTSTVLPITPIAINDDPHFTKIPSPTQYAETVATETSSPTQTITSTSTLSPTTLPTAFVEQHPVCEIVVSSTNLRVEPNRDSLIIQYLLQGETMSIQATTVVSGTLWFFVHLENSRTGWIVATVCGTVDEHLMAEIPNIARPAQAADRNLESGTEIDENSSSKVNPEPEPTDSTSPVGEEQPVPTLLPISSPEPSPCPARTCGPTEPEPISTNTPSPPMCWPGRDC